MKSESTEYSQVANHSDQTPPPPPTTTKLRNASSFGQRYRFALKKWTLLVMMAVDVAMLLVYGIYSNQLADRAIAHLDDVQPDQYDRIKITTVVIIIATSVILIGLQVWFMFGVYRENACLVTAYTVISVLATLVAVFQALSEPFYWIVAVWAAVITAVVALFLRELNQRQQQLTVHSGPRRHQSARRLRSATLRSEHHHKHQQQQQHPIDSV